MNENHREAIHPTIQTMAVIPSSYLQETQNWRDSPWDRHRVRERSRHLQYSLSRLFFSSILECAPKNKCTDQRSTSLPMTQNAIYHQSKPKQHLKIILAVVQIPSYFITSQYVAKRSHSAYHASQTSLQLSFGCYSLASWYYSFILTITGQLEQME